MICGGEKVLVQGKGFTANLQVRFGDAVAVSVRLISTTEVEVVTPTVPETTSAVTLRVSRDGVNFIEREGLFTFRDDRPLFVRGDADGDGELKITDAIAIADYITGTRKSFPHIDAADANDDGLINTGDMVALTGFLFQGSGKMPAPYPQAGRDPTADGLTGCSP